MEIGIAGGEREIERERERGVFGVRLSGYI
jgi:hypothetical protein